MNVWKALQSWLLLTLFTNLGVSFFISQKVSISTSTKSFTTSSSSYGFDDLIKDQSTGLAIEDLWRRYSENRFSINSRLLRSLQSSSTAAAFATTILDRFVDNKFQVESDTIHILISSAFNRNQPEEAESLFSRYFTSNRVIANSRSLNIMVDNYRSNNDTTSVLRYLGLFKTFLLEPDSYTISSMFRLARTPQDVLSLLTQPALQPSLTAPAIRCAVETLGRLGAPGDALAVAMKNLPAEDSVFESRRSGDALVIALTLAHSMSEERILESSNITQYRFDASLDTALKLCDLIGNSTLSSVPSIKMTGKGTTALFTGLQREMRLLHKLRFSGQGLDPRSRDDLNARLSSRASLLRQARSRLLQRLLSPESEQDLSYVLNGRLCDAILRCFIDDSVAAKAVWLTQLLPALRRLEAQRPGRLIEGAEKAFDAMMFVAGFNGCADIGVEIARTARKRNLPREILTKLAKSYSRGKIERQAWLVDAANSGLGALVIDGLERSIEAELGCLLETNKNSQVPIKKIRFQFSTPNVTKASTAMRRQT